jgi:hypothetical protein
LKSSGEGIPGQFVREALRSHAHFKSFGLVLNEIRRAEYVCTFQTLRCLSKNYIVFLIPIPSQLTNDDTCRQWKNYSTFKPLRPTIESYPNHFCNLDPSPNEQPFPSFLKSLQQVHVCAVFNFHRT